MTLVGNFLFPTFKQLERLRARKGWKDNPPSRGKYLEHRIPTTDVPEFSGGFDIRRYLKSLKLATLFTLDLDVQSPISWVFCLFLTLENLYRKDSEKGRNLSGDLLKVQGLKVPALNARSFYGFF